MAKNNVVRLDAQSADFIDRQIHDGRYGSPEEVMRAGLRLLEEREAQLDEVRVALIEGEASGTTEEAVEDIWRAELAAARRVTI